MGAYTPLPDLSEYAVEPILDRVHRPILAELRRRGTPFVGFLYAGLILTSDGPRLLECNARLGDPEAQVILPRLAAPLGPVLLSAARSSLAVARPMPVLPGAAVGIVLAAAGYPASPRRGDRIDGLDGPGSALVFHAGTREHDGTWTTDGGRVLAVVGRGQALERARAQAEDAAEAISWAGMQRRNDIAQPVTAGAVA